MDTCHIRDRDIHMVTSHILDKALQAGLVEIEVGSWGLSLLDHPNRDQRTNG